ncbi:MAG: hypothetical protein RIB98_12145 [Acidimicrobiales bacterium]
MAIELNSGEQTDLTDYLSRSGLEESVRAYYGIDQSDPGLADILDREFGDSLLDLVLDDASHLYWPTRASFELVFPRLRFGGVYVIEDWASQHDLGTAMIDQVANHLDGWERVAEQLAIAVEPADADLASAMRDAPSLETVHRAVRLASKVLVAPGLSRLGLELVHLAAESDDIVRSLEFTEGWIQITRGEGEISGPTWFADGSLDLLGSLASLSDDDA